VTAARTPDPAAGAAAKVRLGVNSCTWAFPSVPEVGTSSNDSQRIALMQLRMDVPPPVAPRA
jgi:hypothetical protein